MNTSHNNCDSYNNKSDEVSEYIWSLVKTSTFWQSPHWDYLQLLVLQGTDI